MIDFKTKQNNIIDFITNNYSNYLSEYNIKIPFITNEFIDFDRFKNDFICFVEFDSTTYPFTYNDDCSITENNIINIYLAHRNNTPDNLNNLMLNSTSAFFKMFRGKGISNSINQKINRIDFFKYIEGTTNICCSKIVLELSIEL